MSCIDIRKGSSITVKEHGRSANFLNPERKPHSVGRIDNCLVEEGIRADYFVSNDEAAVLVELKGCNVKHACDQLLKAAAHPNVTAHIKDKKLGFLIICSRVPKENTATLKARDQARKRYKAVFRVACDKRTVDIKTLRDC